MSEVTGCSLTTLHILPSLFFFHYAHISLPLCIYHFVRLLLPFPNDALAPSFISRCFNLDLCDLCGDLLSRSLPSPPVFIHASPLAPLLTLLFSSSFHQTSTLLSHLHYLNQLLQLTLVIPFHFIPSLFPSRSLSLCLSHLPQLPSDHAASMNL